VAGFQSIDKVLLLKFLLSPKIPVSRPKWREKKNTRLHEERLREGERNIGKG
jgi:hypothetical protein